MDIEKLTQKKDEIAKKHNIIVDRIEVLKQELKNLTEQELILKGQWDAFNSLIEEESKQNEQNENKDDNSVSLDKMTTEEVKPDKK